MIRRDNRNKMIKSKELSRIGQGKRQRLGYLRGIWARAPGRYYPALNLASCLKLCNLFAQPPFLEFVNPSRSLPLEYRRGGSLFCCLVMYHLTRCIEQIECSQTRVFAMYKVRRKAKLLGILLIFCCYNLDDLLILMKCLNF